MIPDFRQQAPANDSGASSTISPALEHRVLVLAPTGSDARHTATFLAQASMVPHVCENVKDLCRSIQQGCAAILLAEEALDPNSIASLTRTLSLQPSWSDIPIVLVTGGGEAGQLRVRKLDLGVATNVMMLERPFRTQTLISALEAAHRARGRQYQLRDLLAERTAAARDLERLVAERTARLQELVEQLEAFSYSITHDMRGPLRAITSYAQLLRKKEYTDPAEQDIFLGRIADAAVRLDRLIQDVLQFSRLGRGEMILEPVNADHLVRAIIDEYPNLRQHRDHITISCHIPPVLANPAALTQCLSNLLGNAVKFVPPDRAPAVRVDCHAANGRVTISIQDNGIGIAPKYLEQIFTAFSRLHDNSTYEGTGIGLAIVKRAVERMNGRLGVSSVPGEGSRFWIELPAA